jgi:hypothetical protein
VKKGVHPLLVHLGIFAGMQSRKVERRYSSLIPRPSENGKGREKEVTMSIFLCEGKRKLFDKD